MSFYILVLFYWLKYNSDWNNWPNISLLQDIKYTLKFPFIFSENLVHEVIKCLNEFLLYQSIPGHMNIFEIEYFKKLQVQLVELYL